MGARGCAIAGVLAVMMVVAAMPAPAQQDYQRAEADLLAMLDRLGIEATRPRANGFDPKASNAANHDEARATLAGPLPELLRARRPGGNDGTPMVLRPWSVSWVSASTRAGTTIATIG